MMGCVDRKEHFELYQGLQGKPFIMLNSSSLYRLEFDELLISHFYTHTYIYTYTFTHTHTHTYIYIYIYIFIYIELGLSYT